MCRRAIQLHSSPCCIPCLCTCCCSLFKNAADKGFVMCLASIMCQLKLTSDGTCRINHLPEITEALHVKRSASNEDLEFQALLAGHTAKQCRNEFNRYIEIQNDSSITSSLSWWKANAALYPDLSKMARDVLATPASGCAVERVFSVSGRIASWQRNWLSAETISALMMFKYGLKRTWGKPDSMAGEAEEFPVPELLGMIPP